MASRYAHLVGVLGEADAGKTCMLCSMYLLASCGQLAPERRFAGSATLRGYESRLRNYRAWPGPGLPDRITPHTALDHPRMPGFLHLALSAPARPAVPPHVYELLFTDLPGEWTTGLINSSRAAERLGFLRRADALVLAFRADQLADPSARHSQLQSGRLLLQRLRTEVPVRAHMPLVIAITRCDLTGGAVHEVGHILAGTARDLGFSDVASIALASFSENENVASGLGVGDLLAAVLRPQPPQHVPEPGAPKPRGGSHFALYRFNERTGARP